MEQKLDKKKRMILIIIAVLILTIGVSLAFIIAQIQDSARGNANVTSDTTDVLTFDVTKDIYLNPTQFNVTEGGGGLSDSAVGTATLRANSTNEDATYTYYVYFQINSNNYVYTTTDQKPEIVLTILDPNDNPVTSVNNLKYVEVTNANGSEVKGFDITTKSGLFNIASLYEITSTSSTEDTIHEWTFTVTFINLDTNQYENGGKTMEAEVILSKELYTMPDVTLAAFSNGVSIDHVYNKNYTVTSNCSNVSWNNKYQGVDISFNDSIPINCNLEYTENNTTTYLNDYIIGLSGTEQGTGEVVNEQATIDNSTFTSTNTFEQSNYSNLSNDGTYPFSWNSSAKTWTSTNKSNSTTSTITFSPQQTGYYQICYTVSSESGFDKATFYVDDDQISQDSGSQTNCVYLGHLSSSNTIKVTYSKDGSSSSGNDNVIFYMQSGTYNENIETISVGIRYEGKDPNNYIWFNNELWRIIGVFDEATHGVSGQNLVKIIKVDSIGGLAWHKSNTNDWKASSLMNLLNGAYYNSENGTGGEYCYGYSTTVPAGNCDYTETGINDTYRPMIEKVTWYLGGHSTDGATAEAFYGYERGDSVYSGRPTTDTGYIGLMYPSDYGYSVLSSSCARTTNLSSYNKATCAGQSWLYGQGSEWTITPNLSDSSNVFYLNDLGRLSYGSADPGRAVRPVLYLDSSVYIMDGNGSVSDPYIIGM